MPSGLFGAGEGDLGHIFILYKACTYFITKSRYNIKNALWKTYLIYKLC